MSPFDFAPLLAPGLPPPAAKWTGFAKYNFVGGHNDRGPCSGRCADQGGERRAHARGHDAGDLWSGQRPAGLPAAARISGAKAQAHRRHRLHRRRNPHHLRIAAGARSRQRHPAARAATPSSPRPATYQGALNRLDPARRQCRRHSARRRRHAHGCARRRARRSQAPRRAAEIHLHHPDRAESDRHDFERGAPARIAAARRRARRADLRGRLLCRSDLGRQAAAGAVCHEQDTAASSISARSPNRSRRRCASATSSPNGTCCRACWRSRPTPAPARSSRWCSANFARRISTPMCRS